MDRIDSFGWPLFLILGSLPLLDRSDILASKFLVELMDSLDELRRNIGGCRGLGFGLGFDLDLRLR